MTNTEMTFAVFRTSCELNQTIADFLDDSAQSLSQESERTGGLEMLFGLAAYSLYRHVKNILDEQKGRRNAGLRQMMEDEVIDLASRGWTKEEALKAVLEINQTIDRLSIESPVVKAGLSILSHGNDSARNSGE